MAEFNPAMRMRATRNSDRVMVKVLMAHPMDTGRQRDEQGALIPAWFIQQVEVWLDAERVLVADWGPAVSSNPYLQFELASAPSGATLRVRWRDNRGLEHEESLVIA